MADAQKSAVRRIPVAILPVVDRLLDSFYQNRQQLRDGINIEAARLAAQDCFDREAVAALSCTTHSALERSDAAS